MTRGTDRTGDDAVELVVDTTVPPLLGVLRRATLLAELPGGPPTGDPCGCVLCGADVDVETGWLVVVVRGPSPGSHVLCDDCTERHWDAAWAPEQRPGARPRGVRSE